MSIPQIYIPKFIQYVRDNARADVDEARTKYGVGVDLLDVKAVAEGVEFVDRLIGVAHLPGNLNRGNHHNYVDIVDEAGRRIYGARVKFRFTGGPPTYATIDKPSNEPGCNSPMYRGIFEVASGDYPSDTVTGLHTGHEDEDVGNTSGHHSFYIVFQRQRVRFTEPEPPVVQALIELRTQVETLAADVATIKALVQAHDQRVKKTAAVWQQ